MDPEYNLICLCGCVSEAAIRKAICSGKCSNMEELQFELDVNNNCHTCESQINEILTEEIKKREKK